MKKNALPIAVLSLFLTSVVAFASPNEHEREYDHDDYYERRGPMPFEIFDLNKDGNITAEEHAKVRKERQVYRATKGYRMRNAGKAPRFEQIDSDNNGSISPDELTSWYAKRLPQGRGMKKGWAN